MEMIRLFDIRTIFLMLPITAILFGLVLWLGPKRDRNEGLQRWIIGLVCVGVSWSLMATRGHLHPAISVAFADGLMVAALSAQAGAFYEFKYQRPPSRKTLIPAVVLFLIFLTIPLSYRTYTLLGSFTISVLGVRQYRSKNSDGSILHIRRISTSSAGITYLVFNRN